MSYVSSIVSYGTGLARRLRDGVEPFADGVGEAVKQLEDRINQIRRLEAALPVMIADHDHDSSVVSSGTIATEVVATAQAITSAGYVDITDLTFPVVNGGTYAFKAWIYYTSSTTACGARFAVNGPAGTYLLLHSQRVALTATPDHMTQIFAGGVDTGHAALSEPSTGTQLYTMDGTAVLTASGTFAARMSKENVAGTITCLATSYLEHRRIA